MAIGDRTDIKREHKASKADTHFTTLLSTFSVLPAERQHEFLTMTLHLDAETNFDTTLLCSSAV
ncbi:MAG TPA: hypothetical protein VF719_09440, partial [Abditibacteriaceae bacterium]